MVQADVLVEPLAAIQISVRRRSRARDRHAKRVELVGVAQRAGGAGQEADVAMPVVAVEARRPRAADQLIFSDALQTSGVGLCGRTTDQFVEKLRNSP
jgi:hypothetical protein